MPSKLRISKKNKKDRLKKVMKRELSYHETNIVTCERYNIKARAFAPLQIGAPVVGQIGDRK